MKSNLKSKATWTAVALLVGCVVLAEDAVLPREKHYEAARAALLKSDPAKAKRELKLSLQDDPLHAQSHFLLASLLGREGDLDQATVGFQQTVKLEPNNAVHRAANGVDLANENFDLDLLGKNPKSKAKQ